MCTPSVPIRMIPPSLFTPSLPMYTLLLPVWFLVPAWYPNAMLSEPVRLLGVGGRFPVHVDPVVAREPDGRAGVGDESSPEVAPGKV